MKSLVILTPLKMEARAVARALKCPVPTPQNSTSCTMGELSVHLFLIGMGARNLPELSAPPDAILLAGLAGSIDSRYRVGDVVVGMTSTWLPDLPYPKVSVCYNDQPILSASSKQNASHATGDHIVEMESDPVKRWAKAHGYRLLHLRAISDAHDEEIDPAVLKLVDPFGHSKPGAILKTLATRPDLIPKLMRLNKNAKTALGALSDAIPNVLRAI